MFEDGCAGAKALTSILVASFFPFLLQRRINEGIIRRQTTIVTGGDHDDEDDEEEDEGLTDHGKKKTDGQEAARGEPMATATVAGEGGEKKGGE